MAPIESIKNARLKAGLAQAELAMRAGISRQALGAIEAGLYQPGVAVAIKLARELALSVESLFGVEDQEQYSVTWMADKSHPRPALGNRVSLARLNGRLVAVPTAASALTLAPVAGIVCDARGDKISVRSFRSRKNIDATILLAGCDPGVAILADWMMRNGGGAEVVAVPCSSGAALDALIAGRANIAGVHLRDPRSGEYNGTSVRRRLGRRRVGFVNFATWEIGLAISNRIRGKIREVGDLGGGAVRIVNREIGSGARNVLDEALKKAGLDAKKIAGYDRELGGHLEVASAINSGDADAGVTIRVAAEAYGLDFVPIREERYDFVIPDSAMETAPVTAILEALNSARFARELSQLCSYDTRRTGTSMEHVS
jgi:molybdate-binding protein/DNA-binding XRE family transcriptional regulator